jgi:hypothetical protein
MLYAVKLNYLLNNQIKNDDLLKRKSSLLNRKFISFFYFN